MECTIAEGSLPYREQKEALRAKADEDGVVSAASPPADADLESDSDSESEQDGRPSPDDDSMGR